MQCCLASPVSGCAVGTTDASTTLEILMMMVGPREPAVQGAHFCVRGQVSGWPLSMCECWILSKSQVRAVGVRRRSGQDTRHVSGDPSFARTQPWLWARHYWYWRLSITSCHLMPSTCGSYLLGPRDKSTCSGNRKKFSFPWDPAWWQDGGLPEPGSGRKQW